jgi:predicted Zn-dependent protease
LKTITSIPLIAIMLLTVFYPTVVYTDAAASGTIDLEEFHWATFPLKVFLDMNEWSLPSYAADVRDALDAWIEAIWNYSQTFNDTTLASVSYVFYVRNVNSTNKYDVLITFTKEEISPPSNAVGLTTYRFNDVTHLPLPPITIDLTTYSATAADAFIKNVAMHEFGHALGLGHASSQSTSNGPELMYYISVRNKSVYPSTLDVYGLTVLYKGNYDKTVQLPPDIPYVMLPEGNAPLLTQSQTTEFWQDYGEYILLALIAIVIVLPAVLARRRSRREPQETEEAISTPPPPP